VNGIVLVDGADGLTANTTAPPTASSLASAKSAAKALLKNRNIPTDRRTSLVNRVAAFLQLEDPNNITEQDLITLADSPVNQLVPKDRIKSHEKIVVEAFKGREQELVERWRSMFLETCKPRHLPQFWKVGFVKPPPFQKDGDDEDSEDADVGSEGV